MKYDMRMWEITSRLRAESVGDTVGKQRQTHTGAAKTGPMEPFHVDSWTPAPPDGIRFSAEHAASGDHTKAEWSNLTSGQRLCFRLRSWQTEVCRVQCQHQWDDEGLGIDWPTWWLADECYAFVIGRRYSSIRLWLVCHVISATKRFLWTQ